MAKKSYLNFLKEAVNDFTEIPKNVDVKGPMTDAILNYDGGGELTTHKDAASILERYYFNENNDEGIDIMSEDNGDQRDNDIDQEDVAKDPRTQKKQIEKAVAEGEDEDADDAEEVTEDENKGPSGEEAAGKGDDDAQEDDTGAAATVKPAQLENEDGDEDDKDKEEVTEADDADKEEDEEETMENAVIEKLIGEMEDEDEDKEEVEESAPVKEEDEAEEKPELDVDAAVDGDKEEVEESEVVEEKVPGNPDEMKGDVDDEDKGDDTDAVSEAFNIFREAIEDEDDSDEKVDADDVAV